MAKVPMMTSDMGFTAGTQLRYLSKMKLSSHAANDQIPR